jgi:hypothetical protein
MKRFTGIAAMVIGLGVFFSLNASAIAPGASESGDEKDIRLENWMVKDSWIDNDSRLEAENEIKLENWMINEFELENNTIALEDWMINEFELENNTIALEDWMTNDFIPSSPVLASGF